MKIRMLQTVPGSIDGVRVTDYEAGAEYDLSATPGAQELAAAFVGAGMAEAADAPAPPEKPAKAKK